jgi:energy-coupling factor transporter ATP-binding protein EcfA2
MPAVIEVQHPHKSYGKTVAVDDISFAVEEGEIFGILGPNGAGKSTTVECIEGLRAPDRGQITVLGLDPPGQATPAFTAQRHRTRGRALSLSNAHYSLRQQLMRTLANRAVRGGRGGPRGPAATWPGSRRYRARQRRCGATPAAARRGSFRPGRIRLQPRRRRHLATAGREHGQARPGASGRPAQDR